jgi:nucleoside-diphosphate-sugar epimerase
MFNKKTIFLTGATGNMGKQGLRQLLERVDRFNLLVLVLPTKKDRAEMKAFKNAVGLKIIWGDLTNYEDVLQCVNEADYVLHVGGMVSPKADYNPELTTKVNIGAIQNILKAIKAQPDPDRIKLVYIGSVAQTGDRNAPLHWGRIGDPIKISAFDNYALTKTIAEREVVESGLKYWVSLRQTGILYGKIVGNLDPILFHEPLNGVLEWVTDVDSGRLLANVCENDVPEEFWCRIYNVGGGPAFRTVNADFLHKSFQALGIKDFRKVVERNWFATQNFHGQWYEDSGILENYLHFRSGSLHDFIDALKKNIPFKLKLAKFVPACIMKHLVFKPVANKPLGPIHWIRNGNLERISAFFGSKEKWQSILPWKHSKPERPSDAPIRLDHGYDENKPWSELELDDMKQAAAFRGGKCVSSAMEKGNLTNKLKWECAFGHLFDASPKLVLMGGHWCPDCMTAPWRYDEVAKHNPFFAQVWKKNSV